MTVQSLLSDGLNRGGALMGSVYKNGEASCTYRLFLPFMYTGEINPFFFI